MSARDDAQMRCARFFMMLFVCAGFPVATAAQGVPAGTVIEGIATASFNTSAGSQTVSSDPVAVVVNEVLAVAVTSVDAGSLDAVGSDAVLTFEITNIGNGPEAFNLRPDPSLGGNDFDLIVAGAALDTNGNAQYDPGIDTALPDPAQTPELAPGETVTIFLDTRLPSDAASGGSTSMLELRVEALTGSGDPGTVIAGQGVAGSDAVIGVNSGSAQANGVVVNGTIAVTLTKSAVVTDPFGGNSAIPGARILYSITASIAGNGAVDTLTITDSIPDGSVYAPGTLALDGASLTDAGGDDDGNADGTAIAVSLVNVAAGTDHTLSFEVVID